MVYSDIIYQLFSPKFPALPSALLRFCRRIIDLSKIYVWNDAVLLLALRYHQHVIRSGQTNHEQWSPIPDNVVYQFCRPDKVLASTVTAQTSGPIEEFPQNIKDPNDSTVLCLNFRKYGECRFTGCKRRHEETTQPAGGPQASKNRMDNPSRSQNIGSTAGTVQPVFININVNINAFINAIIIAIINAIINAPVRLLLP